MYVMLTLHFMVAKHNTIEFHNLSGCIPWTDIVENPHNHLSKRSQVDSDYHLEEPSHMKSNAIDFWLRHWLHLQNKEMCLLVLIDNSNKSPKTCITVDLTPPIMSTQWKVKVKVQYIEPNDSDSSDTLDNKFAGASVRGNPDRDTAIDPTHSLPTCSHPASKTGTATGIDAHLVLLQSPFHATPTYKSHSAFLTSLSDNVNYQKMIVLLGAAIVSGRLFAVPLADLFIRMVTSWRDLYQNGHLGHLRTTICLMSFLISHYHYSFQLSSGGF
jgi:hypothetical protein